MLTRESLGEDVATIQARGHLVHTDLVRLMLLARGLERRALDSHLGPASRHGRMRGLGAEAVAVGAAAALGPDDRLFAPDRYLAAHLTRGLAAEDYLVRCLGGDGRVQARAGDAIGFASPGNELIDLAAGAALALQLRDAPGVAMALVPAEAYESGRCDHAIRAATSRRLPLVAVIEGPAAPPEGNGGVADGLAVEAVSSAARTAVGEARAGGGPVILVCRDDDSGDRDNGERDPIRRELRWLACNAATRPLIAPLRDDVAARINAADRRAKLLLSRARRRQEIVA